MPLVLTMKFVCLTSASSSNNHPFAWGRYCFMHNGAIGNFSQIRVPLLNKLSLLAQQHIKGTTDSEHFAMLFFTYLAERVNVHGSELLEQAWELADIKAALERAITVLLEVQREVIGATCERNSLNVAITDGEQLLAARFRNAEHEFPPSLYYTMRAGVILNRKYPGDPDVEDRSVWTAEMAPSDPADHGDHVIVASEPTTFHEEDWRLIEKNELMMVGKDMTHVFVPIDVRWQ
jgi:glutamine amidotransferase